MFNNINIQEQWLREAVMRIATALEAQVTGMAAKLFVDSFTANGSSNIFRLSNDFLGSSYNLSVNVNGVELIPETDYYFKKIINSVIINGAVLPEGSRVIVRYVIKETNSGQFYNQVEIADGVSNKFMLRHTLYGNNASNIAANVSGVELAPNDDFTYNNTDNSITISGDILAAGTKVLIKYFTQD